MTSKGSCSAVGRATFVVLSAFVGASLFGCRNPPPTEPVPSTVPARPGTSDTVLRAARENLAQAVAARTLGLRDAEEFRNRRVASFGFRDDTTSPACVTPPPTAPADIDLDRSLW